MKPIIVALDVDDKIEALDVVSELDDLIDFYKVGLQLFTKEGTKIVKILKSLNKKVFLDLKYFDIPNTVYKATKQALKFNPDMLTFHCLGGYNMLSIAVQAKKEAGSKTSLLGVTMLTSTEAKDIGMENEETFINSMAEHAFSAGLDGIICSPEDAKRLRKKYKSNFIIVCPGIRIEESNDDQKRIGSPKETLDNGANYLVIGRQILVAKDKQKVVREINT